MVEAKNDMINGQGLKNYEPELLEPTLLCDAKGNLNPLCIGWSRQPIQNCNISGHWSRKKKWNYWNITSSKYLFCIAITDFDLVATAFAYLYNYETNVIFEKNFIIPFCRGCTMSDNVNESIHIKNRELNVSFKDEKGYTKIYAECHNFREEMPLNAEFIIEHPNKLETLNVVIPWDKKRFQFTSKQNCLPVIGTVAIGSEVFYFKTGEALASLDFGRGIWPRKTFWNWATSSGIIDGKSIGLNLGGGWTDGTGITENAILFDGGINKIGEDVIFNYNKSNIMKPWRIRTKYSDKVNVRFVPTYDRMAKTNLVVIKSNIHQVFGHFYGRVVLDNEDVIHIDGLLGCVEEHYAKW